MNKKKILYKPADTKLSYQKDLGDSGQFPFTRGIYPTMYTEKPWTFREFSGFGLAHDTNKRFRFLLTSGQTGLSVAFDLPTLMGYDSDHPKSVGEVGLGGVAIDSLADMEELFKGIPLAKVSTSMTINAPAAIIFAMYLACAKKQKAKIANLNGTLQNDILKEYIAQKEWIFPPRPSLRLIVDTVTFATRHVPKWNAISISGYHIREAGSTAVQEVAFTLANGIAYVQAAVDAGLDVDKFGSQLSFFFNAHNNFFEEIAKFRAARRIWAKIIKERFGAKNEETMKLRFHAQTGGATLTAQQIENNVVRVTMQALAAVLGGCQSLHTNGRDEALALPTQESATIALRTQQIIAHESGVGDTVDPVGGSFFLETLTDEIEARAWELIEKVDTLGGAVKAIEKRFFQNEIAESAYKYQLAIESKEKVIVGVNDFIANEESDIEILRIDETVAKRQIERLNKVRSTRNNEDVKKALGELRNAAGSEQNLIPYILKSVEVYASVGEISDVLREVWGEYKD